MACFDDKLTLVSVLLKLISQIRFVESNFSSWS